MGGILCKSWYHTDPMHIQLQKIVPQHTISRLMGVLARCKISALKNAAIKKFISHYHVNMEEAAISDYKQYAHFNAFFTRHLKSGIRLAPADPTAIVSPVDGCISQIGNIEGDRLLQAKGHEYTLTALLGGDVALAKSFEEGRFLTAYLSPRDYHRIHMPIAGKLTRMIHVPGNLFSVNPKTVLGVEELFVRNERVISLFETSLGKLALIAVGAIVVGSIATRWQGVVTPPSRKQITEWNYLDQNIVYDRGEEMGYFELGSTIIVLFQSGAMDWDSTLVADKPLKLNQPIGYKLAKRDSHGACSNDDS